MMLFFNQNAQIVHTYTEDRFKKLNHAFIVTFLYPNFWRQGNLIQYSAFKMCLHYNDWSTNSWNYLQMIRERSQHTELFHHEFISNAKIDACEQLIHKTHRGFRAFPTLYQTFSTLSSPANSILSWTDLCKACVLITYFLSKT